MKDRITQILKREGISPAEFADRIGVQRSSVSHVLNGRNYPSASFIQKMLEVYRTLNSRWLLLGEGPMFDTKSPPAEEPLLFTKVPETMDSSTGSGLSNKTSGSTFQTAPNSISDNHIAQQSQPAESSPLGLNSTFPLQDLSSYMDKNKDIERIVFFFGDKTFAVYTPSK